MITTDRAALARAITQAGLRAFAFAEMVGISQSHMSCILRGIRNPSPAVALRIARKFDRPFTDFFAVVTDGEGEGEDGQASEGDVQTLAADA